jgi:hypothetical protein
MTRSYLTAEMLRRIYARVPQFVNEAGMPTTVVIAGLDPAIHLPTKSLSDFFEADGPAGQARG